MPGVLDLLQAALQNPDVLRQLQLVSMGPPPRPVLGLPQEYAARQQPGREQALMDQIFAGRQYGPQGGVLNEGSGWAGWGMQPPRSPLNQFMPGAGLY
jgi:hypothetical protein